jgi:diguanylate cyclase (GGDEF)-like protein/PAS domain S-box-containing protein
MHNSTLLLVSTGLLISAVAAAALYYRWRNKRLLSLSSLALQYFSGGVAIFDKAGTLIKTNKAAEKYGFLLKERISGPTFYYIDGVTPLPANEQPLARLLAGSDHCEQELWIKAEESKAGSIVRITAKRIEAAVRSKAVFMLEIHDITTTKWAEKRLEVSEQRFKSLFEHNPDCVFWFDLEGRLLSVNPALQRLTGFSRKELEGITLDTLIRNQSGQTALMLMQKAKSGQLEQFETRFAHKDGLELYMQATVIPITVNNQLVGVYVIAQDITAKQQALETIRSIAYFDSLTGLPNRHHFYEHWHEALRPAGDNHVVPPKRAAILFVDLDRFKMINDSLGHRAGDALLQESALRMKRCVGQAGMVARLSGDEFVVLLYEIAKADCHQIAEALNATLAEPVLYDNHPLQTTASIGISLFPEHSTDPEQLIQFADIAMYQVKEQGKNGVKFFDPEMNEAIMRRTQLEAELRSALDNERLVLHYQPQTDAATGRLLGLEALVRWQHSERGIISPLEFIPIAEESGLITVLGAWVLREACRQAREWLDAGLPPVTVAVNISMKQFQDEELFATIERALADARLPAALLELEITESIGLQGAELVINKLNRLKQLGVRIAIDDFGTGYSSLHYLQKLPLDTLKIDKSFIRNMESEAAGASIVRSVINLAHSLNLTVLAEGVELGSQLSKLADFGCDRLQGYYIARPMPASDAMAWMMQAKQISLHHSVE